MADGRQSGTNSSADTGASAVSPTWLNPRAGLGAGLGAERKTGPRQPLVDLAPVFFKVQRYICRSSVSTHIGYFKNVFCLFLFFSSYLFIFTKCSMALQCSLGSLFLFSKHIVISDKLPTFFFFALNLFKIQRAKQFPKNRKREEGILCLCFNNGYQVIGKNTYCYSTEV